METIYSDDALKNGVWIHNCGIIEPLIQNKDLFKYLAIDRNTGDYADEKNPRFDYVPCINVIAPMRMFSIL